MSPGDSGNVLLSEGTAVRVLTLNRPESRNALDGILHVALLSAIRAVASEPEVRAVVIAGTGDAFSAGGDFGLIQRMQEDPALRRATLDTSRSLFWALLELDVPVIAAVNGPAVGAGATLALLCDIVLMADDAYLAEPRAKIGLVPGDGGAIAWPILAGLPAARAYLLTGDRMPALEAHRLGLIHRVVPRHELHAESMALAKRLSELSSHSVRATKRALNLQLVAAANAALELTLSAEEESFDTPEVHALVQAQAQAQAQAERRKGG
jgi:enoyl-CoA hydratase